MTTTADDDDARTLAALRHEALALHRRRLRAQRRAILAHGPASQAATDAADLAWAAHCYACDLGVPYTTLLHQEAQILPPEATTTPEETHPCSQ